MLSLLFLLAFPQATKPGFIEIPAGRIIMGADLASAKELIAEKPNDANLLGAEVGQEKRDVAGFFMSPTEVTNEMYFQFVKDTGAMPPASWATFTKEKRLAIIKEGKDKNGPAWSFSDLAKGAWWEIHWQEGDVKWELLPSQALMPVTFVNHNDATAYCRWAGLRLPTEEEWVRAARGDTERAYPYGEFFDPTLTAYEATKPKHLSHKALPVGGLPGNASPFGCFDMAGNVWEWTNSGFSALPKFKSFKVKTKAGMLDVFPNFDASSAIIKGGSYQNPAFVSRINTRPGIQRTARVPHIGFRVASSYKPLWNSGKHAGLSLPGKLLGDMAERSLDFDQVLGLEKIRVVPSAELTPHRADPKKPLPAPTMHEAYEVFDRYDCLGIIPLKELGFQQLKKMVREVERFGPVPVAALRTTVALEQANILPGTYILKYIPELTLEFIFGIGASVPPDLMPDEIPVAKEYEDADKDPINFWPAMAGIILAPETEYLLAVDHNNVPKGVIPLMKSPKLERIKVAEHSVTINMEKGAVDFVTKVNGPRGKAWEFRFALKPFNQDGKLSRAGYWTGNYFKVIPKKED